MGCENTSVRKSGRIFATMLSATIKPVLSIDLSHLGLQQLSSVLGQSPWVALRDKDAHIVTQLSFSFSVLKTLKPRKQQAKRWQIFTSTTQSSYNRFATFGNSSHRREHLLGELMWTTSSCAS